MAIKSISNNLHSRLLLSNTETKNKTTLNENVPSKTINFKGLNLYNKYLVSFKGIEQDNNLKTVDSIFNNQFKPYTFIDNKDETVKSHIVSVGANVLSQDANNVYKYTAYDTKNPFKYTSIGYYFTEFAQKNKKDFDEIKDIFYNNNPIDLNKKLNTVFKEKISPLILKNKDFSKFFVENVKLGDKPIADIWLEASGKYSKDKIASLDSAEKSEILNNVIKPTIKDNANLREKLIFTSVKYWLQHDYNKIEEEVKETPNNDLMTIESSMNKLQTLQEEPVESYKKFIMEEAASIKIGGESILDIMKAEAAAKNPNVANLPDKAVAFYLANIPSSMERNNILNAVIYNKLLITMATMQTETETPDINLNSNGMDSTLLKKLYSLTSEQKVNSTIKNLEDKKEEYLSQFENALNNFNDQKNSSSLLLNMISGYLTTAQTEETNVLKPKLYEFVELNKKDKLTEQETKSYKTIKADLISAAKEFYTEKCINPILNEHLKTQIKIETLKRNNSNSDYTKGFIQSVLEVNENQKDAVFTTEELNFIVDNFDNVEIRENLTKNQHSHEQRKNLISNLITYSKAIETGEKQEEIIVLNAIASKDPNNKIFDKTVDGKTVLQHFATEAGYGFLHDRTEIINKLNKLSPQELFIISDKVGKKYEKQKYQQYFNSIADFYDVGTIRFKVDKIEQDTGKLVELMKIPVQTEKGIEYVPINVYLSAMLSQINDNTVFISQKMDMQFETTMNALQQLSDITQEQFYYLRQTCLNILDQVQETNAGIAEIKGDMKRVLMSCNNMDSYIAAVKQTQIKKQEAVKKKSLTGNKTLDGIINLGVHAVAIAALGPIGGFVVQGVKAGFNAFTADPTACADNWVDDPSSMDFM